MKRLNSKSSEAHERFIRWHKQRMNGIHASIISQRSGYSLGNVYYGIKKISDLLEVDPSTRRLYNHIVINDQARLISRVKKLIKQQGVPKELKASVNELIQIIIYNDRR